MASTCAAAVRPSHPRSPPQHACSGQQQKPQHQTAQGLRVQAVTQAAAYPRCTQAGGYSPERQAPDIGIHEQARQQELENLLIAQGKDVPVSPRDNDLYDILLGLGYSAAEANAAVAAIPADAPDTIDDRIRLALRYFGGV